MSRPIYSLEHAYHESTKDRHEQETILKVHLMEIEKDMATIKKNFLVKELMNQATFDELYKPCDEQRTNILKELSKLGKTISNPSEIIAKTVQFCTKLNTAWASSDIAFKDGL